MASQRNLYDVLNVAPDAERVVIEASYRALMKKYHPDQATKDGEGKPSSAADINRAYEILRDPTRRADYDHREWTRRQSVRLAELQKVAPSPARPRQAFGWGGWLVALLLGIALFVIVQGRREMFGSVADSNLAEAPAEPDRRSQPVKIEPSFVRASKGPNEIERDILMREAAEASNAAAMREAEEEAAKAVAKADDAAMDISQVAPRQITRERASQPRIKPKAPTTARRPGESEEDFLQREGYIY